MKLVLDSTIAIKWYVYDAEMPKALRMRLDFHLGHHELLVPDCLPVECGELLIRAERNGTIHPGEASLHMADLAAVRLLLHATLPLGPRAAGIAIANRLNFADSVYVALAERENCTLLTARSALLRVRRRFSFIMPFASLP